MIAVPAESWNEDQREGSSRSACGAGKGAVPFVLSIIMVRFLSCQCGREVHCHNYD
jgi:hypothetical protein